MWYLLSFTKAWIRKQNIMFTNAQKNSLYHLKKCMFFPPKSPWVPKQIFFILNFAVLHNTWLWPIQWQHRGDVIPTLALRAREQQSRHPALNGQHTWICHSFRAQCACGSDVTSWNKHEYLLNRAPLGDIICTYR